MKKYWVWIVIAAVCLLVLIGTIWAVLGGVSSVMPQTPGEVIVEDIETPSDESVLTDDENYPMVDGNGQVIGEDNLLDDPWAFKAEDESAEEAPAPQDEISETPQDEVMTDEELAVTDEGWSGIY